MANLLPVMKMHLLVASTRLVCSTNGCCQPLVHQAPWVSLPRSCLVLPAACTEAPQAPAGGGTYANCVLPGTQLYPCVAICNDSSYTATASCNGTDGTWSYTNNNTCAPREGELSNLLRCAESRLN